MSDDISASTALCTCCCGITVLLMIATLPFVFTTIQDTERAVVYSRLFARFSDEILDTGGFHTKAYNADVIKWPRTEETIEFIENGGASESLNEHDKILCNSKDGIRINMDLSFQYFPDQSLLLEITKQYREFENWKKLMVRQAESTLRNVCGDFIADEYQTARGLVAGEMQDAVKRELAVRYNATLTKLQLRNVDRPRAYENAVSNKEDARSQIDLALNEEAQALTQAETRVDVAAQEAAKLLDTATTNAEIRETEGLRQREGIVDRFDQLASVYLAVKTEKQLSTKGILTYISNEVFMDDVTLAVDIPAQVTFRDEVRAEEEELRLEL